VRLDSLGRNAERSTLLIVDDASRRPLAEFLGPMGRAWRSSVPRRTTSAFAWGEELRLERLLAGPYEFIAMMDA